jgi:lipid-binding SYLF domain-containing protein
MKTPPFVLLVLAFLPVFTASVSMGTTDDLHEKVLNTIADFKKADPDIEKFFKSSVGYAVFPTVGKGAIGIGAAHGSGELIVGGKALGKTTLTQVTVGFQLGGQSYSEVIFFEQQNTLDGFKNGDFAFAAQASAVAVTAGAAANAGYRNGVAVFTRAKGGLMYEASVGGQKFSFDPYGAD